MNINEINPYIKNAKKHPEKQIKLIAESIKRFGFDSPIIIDKSNEIIAGHGRLEAAKLLGLTDVPVILKENLTEQEVKAYRLADNKIAESEWDMSLAIDELKGLDDDLIDITGFDRDLLIEDDEQDDIIPEDVPSRSKIGDLYELGNGHRVLCGDSTKSEDVEKLMGGEKAKMCFTSPPYNMANKKYYDKYKDDLESQEYIDFNIKVIQNIEDFIRGFIFWNISYNKNSRKEWIEVYYNIMKQTNFRFLESIVWDKGHGMPITQKDALTRQYESIISFDDSEGEKEIERFYLGNNGNNVIFNKKTQRKLTNYWYIDTFKSQNGLNQACFPVALPTKAIMTMTQDKDIVLDPFLGVGSTLIACEKTNRICYGIELSEEQVNVIIQRYVDYIDNPKVIKNGIKEIWKKTEKI
ncbi:MAG: methylase N-4/N-6 domain protein [Microgenomates group bacterium GW2011_GWC1_46_16]|nr:MAG: methylase N-4/N-6 domain protein [Microgenomates group bacterium GW2011_GWC1_46_16]